MPKNKAAKISEDSVEILIDEVLSEGCIPYQKYFGKLLKAKRGTGRYRELLCELNVAANVVEVKAKAAQEMIEEYLESLPDDDDD
ncbi:MAG: hypothetical protein ACRD2G_18600 [Terriglobia bacterium]